MLFYCDCVPYAIEPVVYMVMKSVLKKKQYSKEYVTLPMDDTKRSFDFILYYFIYVFICYESYK